MEGRKYKFNEFRRATPEEVRIIQLELLEDVLNFCEKKNIRVFLAFGSLIGAIRHKGYIPWDDDIDLWMPRKDYEKFVYLYNETKTMYSALSILQKPDFPYYFTKVCHKNTLLFESIEGEKYNIGINIDIFPLDDIPIDTLKGKVSVLIWQALKIVHTIKGIALSKKRSIYKQYAIILLNMIFRSFDIKVICKNMDIVASAFKNSAAKYVFSDGYCLIVNKNLFSEVKYAEFEKLYVPIPSGYDEILKTIYGDYSSLPPEKNRITHHEYEAFIKIVRE